LKIEIEKYSWSGLIAVNEVNFFSTATHTLLETFTVHDDITNVSYLVENSFGSINYDSANIDEKNNVYMNASDVSFKVYNKEVLDLDSFFEIYSLRETVGYRKFKLNVFDENNLIYTAYINTNNIRYQSRASQILDITAIGAEKEFRDYYSTQIILHPDLIDTEYSIESDIDLFNLDFKYLSTVIGLNFAGVSITFPSIAGAMWVADKPYIFSPVTAMSEDDMFECKSGLINFYNAGMTRIDYLNYLCFSLGWVWFFHLGRLIIRPAYDTASDELVIDYNTTFIEHSIENSQLDFAKENLIIACGEYYSANSVSNPQSPLRVQRTEFNEDSTYVGGGRDIVYSLVNNNVDYIRPYKRFDLLQQLNSNDYRYGVHYEKVMQRVNTIDTNNKTYLQQYVTINPNNAALYDISETTTSYNLNNSVYITTGVTGRDNGAYLDVENARAGSGRYYGAGNSLSTTNEITDTEIGYTGSVGESIIYKDVPTGKYYTYENLMRKDFMKKNFLTFVKNNSNVMLGLNIFQLITNPLQTIKIINYPFADINNIPMTITGLSYNIFTRTTNLNVQY